MDSFDHEPLSKVSEKDRPCKFTLEVEADRVECPLNTVVFMLILTLILANSKYFLNPPRHCGANNFFEGFLNVQ